MLRELSITNFKSFGKETLFSMEADIKRVNEHKNHIITMNGIPLKRVTSLYGPNGGGKTNLNHAIFTLRMLVVQGKTQGNWNLHCVYSGKSNIEEEAYFLTDKYEIGYRVKYDVAVETSLNAFGQTVISNGENETTIFHILEEEIAFRKAGENDFVDLVKRNQEGKIESSFASDFNFDLLPKVGISKSIVSFIYETFGNANLENLSEPVEILSTLFLEINSIENFGVKLNLYSKYTCQIIEKQKSVLLSLLESVDIKISDISTDSKNRIFFIRTINDKNGKPVEKRIPLYMESSGTQKIFELFLQLIDNFKYRKIYLADDLNALLHPKMVKAVIDFFNSDLNKYSQLIYNSHDFVNMNNEVFRRDEIWFAYRDDDYQTNLVPLSNIVNFEGKQIRNDAKYNKQYLEGKYGADPFIQQGLNWGELGNNETKRN